MFLDRGVPAATLDQITRRAGVAKGTFYLHFESKEHLLAALQRDFEGKLVTRIDTAVANAANADGGWSDRLDAWLTAAMTDYPTDRALHDVLFHHPLLADHGAAAADHTPGGGAPDLVGSLTTLIRGGVADGAFDTADAELTAMLLCSALHRMFDRIWHRDDTLEPARMTAATRQLFRRALALPDA